MGRLDSLKDFGRKYKWETDKAFFCTFHLALAAMFAFFVYRSGRLEAQSVYEYRKLCSAVTLQGAAIFILLLILLFTPLVLGFIKAGEKNNEKERGQGEVRPFRKFVRTYKGEMLSAYFQAFLLANLTTVYTRYQVLEIDAQDIITYRQIEAGILSRGAVLFVFALLLLYILCLVRLVKRKEDKKVP